MWFFSLALILFLDFFVIHTMSGACQISLVDKSAIVALWNSTDQKASNIWNRTENVHTQSVEKDRAILPKVSLQKHPKANKGSCWCAKGSHQIFNVYCTWNLHHFLFIWWCSWQTVPAPLNSMLSFLYLIRSFFKFWESLLNFKDFTARKCSCTGNIEVEEGII